MPLSVHEFMIFSPEKEQVQPKTSGAYGFAASDDAHTYNTIERTTMRIVKMKIPIATQEQILAAFAIPASGWPGIWLVMLSDLFARMRAGIAKKIPSP